MESVSLVFVLDPYSVWSYASCGTIKQVVKNYSDRLHFKIIPTGLFSEISAVQQTRELALIQKREAEEVETVSGVKCGLPYYSFIEKSGGVIDSEIPSSAILAVQKIKHNVCFDYLCSVLTARFVDGKDIGDRTLLADLAVSLGVNRDEFETVFNSPENIADAEYEVYDDKSLFEKMPIFYLTNGNSKFVMATKYISYNDLTRKLERFLDTEEE